MKKTIIALLLFFGLANYNLSAQETALFQRKGKFLLETRYNIIGGLNSGTGFNLLADPGGSNILSLGADAGYFLSEDFALKFRLGTLSGDGSTLVNLSLGGKYYVGGVAPLELNLGALTGGGSIFIGSLMWGYAVELAPNILLEPSIGVLQLHESTLINFQISFAMIF